MVLTLGVRRCWFRDKRVVLRRAAGCQSVGGCRRRGSSGLGGDFVSVVKDFSNRVGFGGEGEDFHLATAPLTGHRLFKARRGGEAWSGSTGLAWVGMANAIGVSAVEMNQVLVVLGDVCEDSGQELAGGRFTFASPRLFRYDARPEAYAGELQITIRGSRRPIGHEGCR